ncbi:F-type H+-transporting ATPase subunit delta [Acrasis kona]|uniref:F-type H+-transporting ATPase subunit delta n=1 Tax=Acrasis kona TaxID=1008807 RepID=A0AAW2ZJM7_9EUKA
MLRRTILKTAALNKGVLSILPRTVSVRSYAKQDDENDKAMSFYPNRFVNAAPENIMAPVNVKKLSVLLSQNTNWILRNEKVDAVEFVDLDKGAVSVQPQHMTEFYRIKPGVLTLRYDEERTDKYYQGGGLAHVFYFGPVSMTFSECYRLEDLDAEAVRQEIDGAKEKLKNKNDKVRGQAELALEFYEPLLKELEKLELGY